MTITLARPDKKNALSNAMYGVLADSLEQAETDPAVRVVVFQADGDSFSSRQRSAGLRRGRPPAPSTGERHVMRFLKTPGQGHAAAGRRRPGPGRGRGHDHAAALRPGVHQPRRQADRRRSSTWPWCPRPPPACCCRPRIGHARAYAMFALGEAVSGETAAAWGIGQRLRAAGRRCAPRPAPPPTSWPSVRWAS